MTPEKVIAFRTLASAESKFMEGFHRVELFWVFLELWSC